MTFKAKWQKFWSEPSPWWGLLFVPFVVLFAVNGRWSMALEAFWVGVMIGITGWYSQFLGRWHTLLVEQSALAHERYENLNRLTDSLMEKDVQLTERERRLDAAMGRARHVN